MAKITLNVSYLYYNNNYNNAAGLKKTIESVVNQTFKNFEFLIIDGGSSDGSLNIIKGFEKDIDYWISEKDSGVYNAMNKGIKRAMGEYLFMLNSGDYLLDKNVLQTIFEKELNQDIIYGDLMWEDQGNLSEQKFPDIITLRYFRDSSLGHQAAFIRRSLHQIIGLYDERFYIVSDWKFFLLSICKYNVSKIHISLPISVCSRDGLSCKPENLQLIYKEKDTVFTEEFPSIFPDYLKADETKHILNTLLSNRYIRIAKRLRLIKN